MNIIFAYFKLQGLMLNRRISEAGIKPIWAYALLLCIFLGSSVYLFENITWAEYVYVLIALTLIGNLSSSDRNEFLKFNFSLHYYRLIRIGENVLLSLPFIIFLAYKTLILHGLGLLVLSIGLIRIQFRTAFNYTLWTPFSKKPFEFVVGFRNSYLLIILAYLISFMAVKSDNMNLGLFALGLVFACSISYFFRPEPEFYIWIHAQKPKAFLVDKLKTAIQFSGMLILPIVVVLSVCFIDKIHLILMFVVVAWAFLMAAILSKYAAFPDELNIIQGLYLAFSIWFPPLLIILIPYLWFKSKQRLNFLLA